MLFREEDDSSTYSYERMGRGDIPGNAQATNLLSAELGIDADTFGAAGLHWLIGPGSQTWREAKRRARE